MTQQFLVHIYLRRNGTEKPHRTARFSVPTPSAKSAIVKALSTVALEKDEQIHGILCTEKGVDYIPSPPFQVKEQ